MKQQSIFQFLFYMVFFFFLQLFLLRNVVLFDLAFCFVYVGAILLIPIELPQVLALIFAFIAGFFIDVFYDTIGIHMAACVLIAYIRPYVVNFLTPRGGYDANSEVSIAYMGFQWFVSYALVMVFVHHFVLFAIESWGFGLIFRMLGKTILSTLFTVFVIVLFQYLFSPSKKQ